MAYIVEFCHVNVYNVILRMSTMLFINPTICSTTELAKLIMFKGPVMHENIDVSFLLSMFQHCLFPIRFCLVIR